MKALVVDDSRAMRSILKRAMTSNGFEVMEAENGQRALDFLGANGAVDVVLVDWNMPEMNGLRFVSQVRADSKYDDMRLIIVSIESDQNRVQEALAAGCDEYLMKPFSDQALTDKLGMLGLAN